MQLPDFCPNTECEHHNPDLDYSGHLSRFGTYFTRTHRIIHRFQCHHCKKTFSEQTFHLDNYTNRIINYQLIEGHLTGSCSIRHMSRIFGVNTRTIQNRTARLARQILTIQHTLIPSITLSFQLCNNKEKRTRD